MSQIQQETSAGRAALRGRERLSSVSRRAVGYFTDPGEAEGRGQDTAEFAADVPPAPAAAVVLPLTRSGAYEREAVDRRLAELEHELAETRAAAATPTGVEAEIQYLGEETAEILRVAHERAGALVARATEEAEMRRLRAQAEATATTEAAEARLRQLDTETELIWAERTRLTDDTLRLAEALRAIAESAVGRFPAAPADEAPAPAADATPPDVSAAL
ncbi:MAG: hypothetical protein ACR2KV_06650 [Solirubrobacteraceae bacterium]